MIYFSKDDFINGDVYVYDKYLDYVYFCNGSSICVEDCHEWRVSTLALSTLQEWMNEDKDRYIISRNKSKRTVK